MINSPRQDRVKEEDPRNPRPQTLWQWPRYFFRAGKLLCQRMFYVIQLVWEARPWIIFLMTFMSVFTGLQPIAGSYIAKLLLDRLVQAAREGLEGGFWQLGGLLLLQLAFQLFVKVVHSLNNMVTRLSNEVVSYSIRLKLMKKSATIDLASFDLPEFYSKLENANREAGNRPLQLLNNAFSIFSTVISMVSFIILLGTIIPWAPPLIIAMAIPSAVIHYRYRTRMFYYVRRKSKERRQMNYFSNLLTNKDMVKELKLFHLAGILIDHYKEVFRKYYQGVRELIVKEGMWGIVLNVLQTAANASIFLTISRRVFDRILTVGDYTLYSNALFSISNGVTNLVNTTAGIYEGTLFIDNMITFMEEEPKIAPSLPEPRQAALHAPHEICFQHVSFCYPGFDKPVLSDINLTIRSGETVVLVGLNGAGKTTLLKLLTRLYDPTEGKVTLDGRDIREYDVDSLYRLYGIIFQDFGKYAFTVAENIGFGQVERVEDRNAITEAAQQSTADAFIGGLSQGYDTPLTRTFEETGTELSIGQWQKISVARAFFRESDIIILDEPTASLDPMAEQEIFQQFDRLRGQDKITIFVSHRLSSATIADRIFVLEHGRIIEEGNHRQLMDLGGKYAQLFLTQAERYLETVQGGPLHEKYGTAPDTRR